MAEGDFSAGSYVVEIDVLFPLFVGVSVVENPLIVRQICAMAVFGHNIFAYNLDSSAALRAGSIRAVLIKIERTSVRGMPGPGEDVAGVAPDKM